MQREHDEKEANQRAQKSRIRLDDAGTQKSLAKKKKDQINIPIPTKRQFEGDLTKVIRKRKP